MKMVIIFPTVRLEKGSFWGFPPHLNHFLTKFLAKGQFFFQASHFGVKCTWGNCENPRAFLTKPDCILPIVHTTKFLLIRRDDLPLVISQCKPHSACAACNNCNFCHSSILHTGWLSSPNHNTQMASKRQQQANPKARFPVAGTRQRHGRVNALVRRAPQIASSPHLACPEAHLA